jgi:hypothetical protein
LHFKLALHFKPTIWITCWKCQCWWQELAGCIAGHAAVQVYAYEVDGLGNTLVSGTAPGTHSTVPAQATMLADTIQTDCR